MLTPKQQCFVQEYLIDLNATQAAVRAGYSAKTVHVQGPRLLSNVSVMQAISAAQLARAKNTGIDAAYVLRRAVLTHETCFDLKEFAASIRALELVGKHVDIQAFRERHEHAGPAGGAIPLRFDLSKLSDDEIEALERIRSRIVEADTEN